MLCDRLPTLLAAWMGALGQGCPKHTLEKVLSVQSWWALNFLAVVMPLWGITHLGYPPGEEFVSDFVTLAKPSHHWFSRFNCPALLWPPGACAELVLSCASPTARQVLLCLAPLPGREGRQVVAPRLPRVTVLLPLSQPRAISCCQHRTKQTSASPVLFPLCQLVMFIWWAGATLKITLGKNSNSGFVLSLTSGRLCQQETLKWFFPSYQLFSNR